MNLKVGTDIVSIDRIKNSIDKFGDKFLYRFLNKEEIDSLKKVESIAGYWAAKEAIAKALGCGIGKELKFKDITIKKDIKGAPFFTLKNKNFDIFSSSVSISHDNGFAIAVVIVNFNYN